MEWEGSRLTFRIEPVQGQAGYAPPIREYTLVFHNLQEPEEVTLDIEGGSPTAPEYDPATHQLILSGLHLRPNEGLIVRMQTSRPSLAYTQPQIRLRVDKLLAAFRLGNKARGTIAHQADSWISDPVLLAAYQVTLTRSQLRALLEVTTQAGVRAPHQCRGRAGYPVEPACRNRPDVPLVQ